MPQGPSHSRVGPSSSQGGSAEEPGRAGIGSDRDSACGSSNKATLHQIFDQCCKDRSGSVCPCSSWVPVYGGVGSIGMTKGQGATQPKPYP